MKSIYFKKLPGHGPGARELSHDRRGFVFIGQGYVIKSHRESMEQNAKTVTRLVVSMLATDRYIDAGYLRVMLTSGEHLGQPGLFD